MKLKNIQIYNFKSIRFTEIDFEDQCKILVGKNESGKTSILEAASQLGDTHFDKDDIRLKSKIGADESKEDPRVRFTFELSPTELAEIAKSMDQKFTRKSTAELSFITSNTGEKTNLKNYIQMCFNGGVYYSYPDSKESHRYLIPNNSSDYELTNSDWLIVPENFSTNETFMYLTGPMEISSFSYVKEKHCTSESSEIDFGTFIRLDMKKLNQAIGAEIIKYLEKNKTKCFFWKFEEENLVQDKVDIDAYITNPENYRALSNILLLYGIENPIEAIKENVKDADTNITDNFLEQVSRRLTAYINEIWKEYSEIKLEIRYSNNALSLYVLEHDKGSLKYKPSQRSYGFKKFLLFLLDVSIEVDFGKLSNCLVLIDEPEIGLHPSAVEYFKEKLLDITENKSVNLLYSTHSEHAIDRKNISRHYIVIKDKEETSIKIADNFSYFQEQVLLSALGTSAFRQIKEKNIVFEGWTDHFVFNQALGSSRKGFKISELHSFFNSVGAAFVDGARQVKKFTPIMQLAEKNCFILTDSDDPSLEARKDFKKNKLQGDWHTYGSVLKNNDFQTLEDFIKDAVWKKEIKACQSLDVDIPNVYFSKKPRLKELRIELNKKGKNSTQIQKICNELKSQIFSKDFKPSHLEDEYFDMLNRLKAKLT